MQTLNYNCENIQLKISTYKDEKEELVKNTNIIFFEHIKNKNELFHLETEKKVLETSIEEHKKCLKDLDERQQENGGDSISFLKIKIDIVEKQRKMKLDLLKDDYNELDSINLKIKDIKNKNSLNRIFENNEKIIIIEKNIKLLESKKD